MVAHAGSAIVAKVAPAGLLYFAAIFALILLIVPPNGVLADNEENYFGLAAQSLSPLTASPYSALFDSSRHRFANEFLLGYVIEGVGFEAAQMIARTVSAALLAWALSLLLRLLAVPVLDAVAALLLFVALNQTLAGGEWLFRDYEGKVAAYGFVLFGLYSVIAGKRTWWSATAFVIATYFHFQVGGFWFAAAIVYQLMAGRERKPMLVGIVIYSAAILPVVAILVADRIRDVAPTVAGVPDPDEIYSMIRAPHHVAPFVSWTGFMRQWLPGLGMAGLMLLGAIAIARCAFAPTRRRVALWVALLLSWLFIATVLSYLDRDTGALGKFYLFRPASLTLLLWLALGAAYVGEMAPLPRWLLRGILLAATVPGFVLASARGIPGDLAWRESNDRANMPLYAAIQSQSRPSDVVLIDPRLEWAMFDFERRTGRASLVMWKFDNTNDRDIVEWYRRLRFRDAIFDKGCGAATGWPVDDLIAAADRADALAASCGSILYRDPRAALIRLDHRSGKRRSRGAIHVEPAGRDAARQRQPDPIRHIQRLLADDHRAGRQQRRQQGRDFAGDPRRPGDGEVQQGQGARPLHPVPGHRQRR